MSPNKLKRIAIICGYSFPDGLAPTNRILTYSKGLVELAVKVHIFIYFPTDSIEKNLPVNGSVNGINYHYPGTRSYPSNKFIRKLSHIFYCYKSIRVLIKENRKEKFDLAIISSDWFRILYAFIPALKIIGLKIVFIADEFPVPIRVYLKTSISFWRKLLFKNSLKFVSGMIFMTQSLKEFYNGIVKKNSFILPSVVDISRFTDVRDTHENKKHLCYMGNMELSKDNVDNIIDAFYLIADKFIDIEFHLYGAPSQIDKAKLIALIKKYNLEKRVLFKGKVNNNEVPVILKNSYILVSSQPDTKRAAGGFPTKLGEYMAVGVPTLLTAVGEIPNYITNGVNGWLAKPNDPQDYAVKLKYIIENYPAALEVADKAKKYVNDNFDYKFQCAKLLQFLNNIVNE
ncbi:glycosyltransferase family 4 protein [Mucilaginibacter sp. RB4R14]|uniref:glycosyltransferase family 4 protein n=1 Tax=Mucilaginibacter aurantiaciroseus TaxID=2949308 RepID=UPI002090DA1A|nr:glycosyltransferase family 4 protein [Mucilaginibacter aurantiaciroseus]